MADNLSKMDPTDDSIFTAGLDDVSSMCKILHELHHADDYSTLVITKEGIRLVTSGEKSFQVSAYFASSTFQRFKFDHDHYELINFRFMLRDFIECLNLQRDDPIVDNDRIQLDLGPQLNNNHTNNTHHNDGSATTSMYIQYRREGEPLKLRLENNSNYVINCDLKAFNPANNYVFYPLAFLEGEETAVILLNSKKFYKMVDGLDLTASEYVNLSMERGATPIKILTKSISGEVELELLESETDIIKKEISVSDNCLFNFTYRTQFIKPALEALKNSSLVQMKCGSSGLLCIEHFHPIDKPTTNRRQDNDNYMTQNGQENIIDYNQPQNKRSSVEYFILSEAKSIDACPD